MFSSSPTTAICLYGLPRSLSQTAGAIEANLAGPLEARTQLLRLAHQSVEPGSESRQQVSEFLALACLLKDEPGEALERWNYEGLLAAGDFWENDGRSLRNLVHQLHSLYRVAELALEKGVDRCLFARIDLIYDVGLESLADRLLTAPEGLVFLPPWQHWKGGLNDRFAFCSGRRAISAWGQRAKLMASYCERTRSPLHAERLVAYSLWTAGVPWQPLPVRATRIRANGAQVAEDFSLHPVRWARQKAQLRAKWLAKGILPARQVGGVPAA